MRCYKNLELSMKMRLEEWGGGGGVGGGGGRGGGVIRIMELSITTRVEGVSYES